MGSEPANSVVVNSSFIIIVVKVGWIRTYWLHLVIIKCFSLDIMAVVIVLLTMGAVTG